MYYIFPFIDLGYIQRTKQQKAGDTVEKEAVLASKAFQILY
jgi:hypothetical protein